MEAEPTGSNSQGANTTGGANLISFKAVHRIQLSDECIYQAKDEARQLLTLGLLNNEIVTLNAEFQEISKFLHVGNKKINSLRLAEGLVAVAGEDKCVTFYDPRTKTETKKLSLPKVAHDISISKHTLAVGCDKGALLFYDLRKDSKLGEIREIHFDAVCSIEFSKSHPDRLLTGSDDGIVATFDLSQAQLDDAVDSLLNVEEAVVKLNFMGNGIDHGYCQRGGHDLISLDFTTDLHKPLRSGKEQDTVFNTFSNNLGEAFLARGSAHRVFIDKLNAGEMALIESPQDQLRDVEMFNQHFVASTESKQAVVFGAAGSVTIKQPTSVTEMMAEEVADDDGELLTKGTKAFGWKK